MSTPNEFTGLASGSAEAGAVGCAPAWDHSTDERFYNYYAEESAGEGAAKRFRAVRDAVLRIRASERPLEKILDIADVGCGAGSQSMVWAELGHRVHALDVNGPLLDLGKARAAKAGYPIEFRLGSATELPWPGESMDVCILLELLEHVVEWESCVDEAIRVLRPGGTLFLTTTNRLCPKQAEFNLPCYSWYPARVKRRYERLALSTRPDIANFAKYPAVHWFTFDMLKRYVAARGLRSLDRFDMIDLGTKSASSRMIVAAIHALPPLRWVAHVCTAGTILLAIKD